MEGTLVRPPRASVAGAEAPVLATAWRLALRELRGGTRGLRIVIACLALGVAAIAGVGTLTSAVVEGMRADGRRILGGDLEVSVGYREMPQAARDWIEARGGRFEDTVPPRSVTTSMRRPTVRRRCIGWVPPWIRAIRHCRRGRSPSAFTSKRRPNWPAAWRKSAWWRVPTA